MNERSKGAQHWVVRGPDPWLIYGPFSSPQDAIAYGQKTWPDLPQIQYDSGDDAKGWEVEPLYPPEDKVMADRPLHPPGAEIAAQGFDAYAAWESKWCEDLEEVTDEIERVHIYGYMVEGIDIDLAKVMARMDRQT